MSGRVNWSRISNRNRMRRHGVEDRRGEQIADRAPKVRRTLSKAELREQAEAAFRTWRQGQTSKDKQRVMTAGSAAARR
jgi:hypothetical protein